MPTIVFDEKLNIDRDKLIDYLQNLNIDARVFFHPISSLEIFEKVDNKVAYKSSKNGLNLPSNFSISLDDVEYVTNIVKRYLNVNTRSN